MPTTLSGIGMTGDLAVLAAHDPVPRYYLHGAEDARVLAELMADI